MYIQFDALFIERTEKIYINKKESFFLSSGCGWFCCFMFGMCCFAALQCADDFCRLTVLHRLVVNHLRITRSFCWFCSKATPFMFPFAHTHNARIAQNGPFVFAHMKQGCFFQKWGFIYMYICGIMWGNIVCGSVRTKLCLHTQIVSEKPTTGHSYGVKSATAL